MIDDWLFVAKRQGKLEFIKAFERFDPKRVEWTTNVDEAAEFTEAEWAREGAIAFICDNRLCLVSYADEPRKRGERPTRRHGKERVD
jgi:hypothetical protein